MCAHLISCVFGLFDAFCDVDHMCISYLQNDEIMYKCNVLFELTSALDNQAVAVTLRN